MPLAKAFVSGRSVSNEARDATAMSMVFKVADPAMLQGIEKDAEVEFSVDNSSGGFVITDIREK